MAALAVAPVLTGTPPQSTVITQVEVARSTWKAMTIAVTYQQTNVSDTLVLGARWSRLDGGALSFTPAEVRIAPGTGQATLESRFTGLLAPPTPILLRLDLTAPGGRAVWRADCELTLVTPQGRDAWAGDLFRKATRPLSWRVRTCHDVARRESA